MSWSAALPKSCASHKKAQAYLLFPYAHGMRDIYCNACRLLSHCDLQIFAASRSTHGTLMTPEDRGSDMLRGSDSGHSPPVPSQPYPGPGFFQGWWVRRGSTWTIIGVVGLPFRGEGPRGLSQFGCMQSNSQPRRAVRWTPLTGRVCGIFRSSRSRWFSGLSRLAHRQNRGGLHLRRS
jgi:hypothetical protein